MRRRMLQRRSEQTSPQAIYLAQGRKGVRCTKGNLAEVLWCAGLTRVGSRVPPRPLSRSPSSKGKGEKIRCRGLKGSDEDGEITQQFS